MWWGKTLTLQPWPPAPCHLTAPWGAPGTWLSPVHGRGRAVSTARCDGMQRGRSSCGEGRCSGVSREGRSGREGKGQAGRKRRAEQAGREGRSRQQNQARACAFKRHSSAAGSQGCLRRTPIYLLSCPHSCQRGSAGGTAAPCPALHSSRPVRAPRPAAGIGTHPCGGRATLPAHCRQWGNLSGCWGSTKTCGLGSAGRRSSGFCAEFPRQRPPPVPSGSGCLGRR